MSHPTDLELVDFVDGLLEEPRRDEVRQHAANCPSCAALIAEAASPIEDQGHDRPLKVDAPTQMVAGFRAEPGPVARGGMWRLEWAGVAEMVLVDQIEGTRAVVAPMVFDPLAGDERTRLLEASSSPFQLAAAVWTGLRRHAPVSAFAQHFGDVAPDVLDRVLADGHDGELGGVIRSAGEEAAAVRARLIMHLERFQEAKWAPPEAAAELFDVAGRLKQLGLRPSDLATQLDMLPADVTDVLRKRRGFTPTQAKAAAELLGMDPDVLSAAPPAPSALVIELQQPRWRPALIDQARRAGISEHEARTRAVQPVLAMAARTTGEKRGEPDWAQLVGDQLGPR